MRRFPYPYLFLSIAVTITLAGLFYLPYLSVRDKTVDAFQAKQMILLNKVAEGIQDYFSTYHKALEYLATQQSIADMDVGGRLLLEDFFEIHRSQILGIVRTDAQGEVMFTVHEQGVNSRFDSVDHERLEAHFPHTSLWVADSFVNDDNNEGMVFTCPVFIDEVFQGNISFVIPVRKVARKYIESVQLDHYAYFLLVNRSGTIVYSPDSVKESKTVVSFQNPELQLLHQQMNERRMGTFILETDLFREVEGKQPHRFGVYLPVNLPGDNYWTLTVVSSDLEVLGTMTDFRKQWLIVTVITALAVMLLTMGLTAIQVKRQKEREQRQFEEQIVLMLEYAPMGVLLIDSDGIISYANEAAADIVALDSGEKLHGIELGEFIELDDRPRLAKFLTSCSSSRCGDSIPVKIRANDHGRRDAVVSGVRRYIGDESAFIIILQDVTEELKLEEMQRRLAAAVDQVKELVTITDTKGRIVYINPAYCRSSGYTREESIGCDIQQLWKGDDRGLLDRIRAILDQGNVWQGRIVNNRKDGTVFVSASSISPVRNLTNDITHYVTVQRDITREVDFEGRVQQARKMEAIGTLAGGIAHDFNNILGAIIGFTDMALLQCDKETDLYDSLVHIRQGGKRAADLVHQILTFSRQSVLEKSPVTIAPLIKESLQLIRASLPSTIKIDQRIVDPDSKIFAAPVQVQQIIMNLCTNAFYSMRESGGTLTITLEHFPGEKCGAIDLHGLGGCIGLIIQDTGTGMEDNVVQRIFTPFFTTKSPGEGTGMGLSVVQGIVQDLGGEIQVKSVLGKGTTFYVFLPLAQEGSEGALRSGEEPLPTGDEHIVVVDDEKEIRETCSMMLRHFGYKVSTVSQPQEVLAMVEEDQPRVDLVLTDHTMPGMTGVELTRVICKLKPDLPVILCTGYSDKLNYDVAIESGACDFMMKPVDLQELATTVRSALDGKCPIRRK